MDYIAVIRTLVIESVSGVRHMSVFDTDKRDYYWCRHIFLTCLFKYFTNIFLAEWSLKWW